MNKSVTALVFFAVYNFFFTQCVLAKNITIMSFNIRVPVDKAPFDWQTRKNAVNKLIQQTSPDIVGFQEMVLF